MLNLDFEYLRQLYKADFIALTGSAIMVDNPNDYDISIIYTSRKNTPSINLYNNRLKNKLRDNNITFFISTIDDIKVGAYLYPYCSYKLLAGNEEEFNKIISSFNIFNNKESYNKLLDILIQDTLSLKYNWQTTDSIFCRKPYRLLWTCYILDNQSYKLTEEQKIAVNKAHDIKQLSKEQIDFCYNLANKLYSKKQAQK